MRSRGVPKVGLSPVGKGVTLVSGFLKRRHQDAMSGLSLLLAAVDEFL